MTNKTGSVPLWRKVAAAVLTLCLTAGQLALPARAAGGVGPGHSGHDGAEALQAKTTATTRNISANTDLYLEEDITTKEIFKISGEGVVVNLCLNGHALAYSGASTTLITVGAGAELNICDCSGQTTAVLSQPDGTVIDIAAGRISSTKAIVNNAGTFNLHSGALTGCSSTTTTAVTNTSTGTFHMSGGMIAGCKGSTNGGAVYNNKGAFTMSGGSIIGNSGTSGGIVNNAAGGTFEMTGGEITGNTSTTGGGVKNAGTFEMSGGTISGNQATGTTTTSGGGGVYSTGATASVTISGGEISGNTSAKTGGGIQVASGEVTISGNAVIRDNRAESATTTTTTTGGGIHMAGGTVTLSGGTLTGNSAKDGGGVYVTGTSTAFHMTAGAISGNEAAGNGGGLGMGTSGTLNISGGSIAGNRAGTNGAGVYMSGAAFQVSGGPVIETVFLSGTAKNLTVTGALTEGADIRAASATSFSPTGYSTKVTVAKPGAGYTITEDDRKKFTFEPNATENLGTSFGLQLEAGNVVFQYIKALEPTPAATIDYEKETLTGFASGKHSINGGTAFSTTTKALGDYIGTTVSIVKKGSTTTTTTSPPTGDSVAQELAIPARPAAPQMGKVDQ